MTDLRTLGQPALDKVTPNDDDLKLWSVTTIIGALDKPALLYWSAEQTALAAIHNEKTWRGMLADDEDGCAHDNADCAAVKWLRDARFRKPKGLRSATDLGTAVHAACEEYALTGTRPAVDDDVRPFLDQFDGWLQRFSPSYEATEVCVLDTRYGYAGTADGFVTIDGVRFIIDYKTSRKHLDTRGKLRTPYPEQVALQLASYRNAEMAAVWRPRRMEKFRRRYYLLSAEERALAQPVPEVDAGLAIQISPESCEAYPVDVGEASYNAFLYTLECFRWLQETSKRVMGDALVEAEEKAA